jgi:hypothetical protein
MTVFGSGAGVVDSEGAGLEDSELLIPSELLCWGDPKRSCERRGMLS